MSKTVKAFNLLKSSASFAFNGFPVTSDEALKKRMDTCKSCPEWDDSAMSGTGRCRKCGCSTWAKLRMATEACPLKKW